MKQYKILFTSVGRRVELIQAFRNAADVLGVQLLIYGVDILDSAPALLYCDRTAKICRIQDPDYIPQLLELCETEQINALIPTIDTDLLLLSQNKRRFEGIGTLAVVSDKEKIRISRDKRLTTDYFHSIGLHSPQTVDDIRRYDGPFPAIIKPRDGSASVSVFKVNNKEELAGFASKIPEYIVQPYIEGAEYTVDVFCDFYGNPIFITPRIRSAVRAGEVLKTEIRQDDSIIDDMKRLVMDYRPCGPLTVQLIKQSSTGINEYIEINPRFGGGAPLSMQTGADSAAALIRVLSGEKLAYVSHAAIDNVRFSRFDQSVRTTCEFGNIQAVVFDLDDTLYSEKDYVRSGFRAVADMLPQLPDAYGKFWSAFEEGKKVFDAVLSDTGLYSDELKEKCIATYRSHKPDIHLYDHVVEILEALRGKNIKIGIITDGRPDGQHNKLAALGLERLVDSIVITDELGGEAFRKPNDISFRIMQRRLGVPFGNMLYVGDNPAKDFIAPRQLCMQCVWFDNQDGIYSGKGYNNDIKTIHSLAELADLLY